MPIVATSEMQWFLTESWNKGVQAFHEDKLEEAESWMAQAFRFSNLERAAAVQRGPQRGIRNHHQDDHVLKDALREGHPTCDRVEVANGSPDLGSRYGS